MSAHFLDHNMNQTNLFLLLRIVKNDRSVAILLRENLTYKQIGDLTLYALDNNLIEKKESDIILTEKGEHTLNELAKTNKKTNKDQWIEKEHSSKIEQFDITFLYLPDQRDLNLD